MISIDINCAHLYNDKWQALTRHTGWMWTYLVLISNGNSLGLLIIHAEGCDDIPDNSKSTTLMRAEISELLRRKKTDEKNAGKKKLHFQLYEKGNYSHWLLLVWAPIIIPTGARPWNYNLLSVIYSVIMDVDLIFSKSVGYGYVSASCLPRRLCMVVQICGIRHICDLGRCSIGYFYAYLQLGVRCPTSNPEQVKITMIWRPARRFSFNGHGFSAQSAWKGSEKLWCFSEDGKQ